LKRVSTRFWLSASATFISFFAGRTFALGLVPERAAKGRANELTLARLRPGRSTVAEARERYESVKQTADQNVWVATSPCFAQSLTITAEEDTVQTIRVGKEDGLGAASCSYRDGKAPPNRWTTGRGLAVGNACSRAEGIYGRPDSRSPSTRNGQPLELLYYAFDWAGPDVPQVMEVVCSAPKEGNPGRVVEITLAAPSL
jgi:hypothetical protein